ncbi:hypothetical protein PC9H_004499 [Pleurotus ostreatus]|uniref:DUF6534 domain-containing protein n=2 Tax=Pleurotus TaxID=5320 RepID=A0A8H6ZZ08_PLEOS|nr:uncharacterized protein PC9H_004499 [Pleurotus ostreatus]KAF7432558.1 hypothetical protein PC9H_004499 [Pleurotus ostreatus]KAG9218522.1 hypothetical protein CCMSSC00406_0008875 [Pleurotus cornucopiae]
MSATALFSLISSMGAIQIGIVISSFLFGITTLQAFFYYINYPKDPLYLKCFSVVVWILELGGMIFAGHLLYSAAITPYRENPLLMFLDPPYQILATILASNMSGCVVQLYFVERVRRFTKLLWIAIICWTLILYTFTGTLVIVVVAFKSGLVEYTLHWRWLTISGLIVSAAVDIFVAVMMCWNLGRQRGSLFRQSATLVDKIIMMTITTGLMTSLVAVTAAVLTVTLPYHRRSSLSNVGLPDLQCPVIYLGVYICLARVYANSYFASLNARHNLRGTDAIETIQFTPRSNASSNGTAASVTLPKPPHATYLGQYKIDLNGSEPILNIH